MTVWFASEYCGWKYSSSSSVRNRVPQIRDQLSSFVDRGSHLRFEETVGVPSVLFGLIKREVRLLEEFIGRDNVPPFDTDIPTLTPMTIS